MRARVAAGRAFGKAFFLQIALLTFAHEIVIILAVVSRHVKHKRGEVTFRQ